MTEGNVQQNPHPVTSLCFGTEKVFSLFIEKILQTRKKNFRFAPTAFNACTHTNHIWTAYRPAGVSIP